MNIKKTLSATFLVCLVFFSGCSNEQAPSKISRSSDKPVTSESITDGHDPYDTFEDSAYMFFKSFANEIPKTFVKKDNAYHDAGLKINDSDLSNNNYQGSGRVVSLLNTKGTLYFETLLVAQYEQKPGDGHSRLVRFFGRSRIKDEEYAKDEKAGKVTDDESSTFFVLYDFFRNKDIITIYSDNEASVYFNKDMHFDTIKDGWKKARWYNTQNNGEPLKLYPFLYPKRTRNVVGSVSDKHVDRYESLARDFLDTYYNIKEVPVERDSARAVKDISDPIRDDKKSADDVAYFDENYQSMLIAAFILFRSAKLTVTGPEVDYDYSNGGSTLIEYNVYNKDRLHRTLKWRVDKDKESIVPLTEAAQALHDTLLKQNAKSKNIINKVPVEGGSVQAGKEISDSHRDDKKSRNDAAEYIKRGNAFYRSKQYKKAISEYDKAIMAAPKYAPAYYNRGNTYASLKMFEQARKDLLKALELDPALKPNVKKSSDVYKLNLKLD